ncbi:MAG: molybdopterin guanine dinucleotide-containing S/N-oxide reductase [Alphaproteobacteria bacterium]
MTDAPTLTPTVTHWGAYGVEARDGRVIALRPFKDDADPSPIGFGMARALDDACRIRQPMIRAGYLRHGPGGHTKGRGAEPFVAASWDRALDLLAAEFARVKERHGNRSIFAGSYGWASAGRFHHAQSQLHRFLNLAGGYTASKDTYSYAAGEVIIPHVLGPFQQVLLEHTSWPAIAEHGRLVVAFGGLPLRNGQISAGGTGQHIQRDGMRMCRERGVSFVCVGPSRDDTEESLDAEWLAIRPNTDVALMLGLAHTLVAEGLHDKAFLERYCVGFDRFVPYLTGDVDGRPKDADWAAAITEVPAATIRDLARRMARQRTMISLSWSLTRGDHGEQPFWMGVTLSAMLGQIGLPGGGIGFGYSAVNAIGAHTDHMAWPSLDQLRNPVEDFIPVARITELLSEPGKTIDYNGRRITFPDIRLVYWAGGNPFHHHQDLNRLIAAWRRPDTIVCHETWWNALARHSDIVLPATTTFERNDFSGSSREGYLFAMHRAMSPVGEARSDHDILAGLAERFGVAERFTEGRDEMGWLRHLYDRGRQCAAERAIEMPDFDTFWRDGFFKLPERKEHQVMLAEFRADPSGRPLKTPSGRIEIFSQTIDGFGYDDCLGHPAWFEPTEWLGSPTARRFPLHLISCQPATRLHAQYDNGGASLGSKIKGREPVWINADDAKARGIADGDVVRVWNDRGQCLAGAVVSDAMRPGVVRLPTGAWYDPDEPGAPNALCRHGNPNVLTLDKGTSRLAQGPSAQTCLIEVERWTGPLPEVGAFTPPKIAKLDT